MKRNLKAIVWKEGKQYVSQCLNVDIASVGSTKREALKNLQEAVSLYFEDNKKPTMTTVQRAEIVAIHG